MADKSKTAAWQRYWNDPKAPHPDAEAAKEPLPPRIPIPLGKGGKTARSHLGYCHHYRLPNEHYHASEAELEACES